MRQLFRLCAASAFVLGMLVMDAKPAAAIPGCTVTAEQPSTTEVVTGVALIFADGHIGCNGARTVLEVSVHLVPYPASAAKGCAGEAGCHAQAQSVGCGPDVSALATGTAGDGTAPPSSATDGSTSADMPACDAAGTITDLLFPGSPDPDA